MNWRAKGRVGNGRLFSCAGDKVPGVKRSRRRLCNCIVAFSGLLLALTCLLWARSFHVGRVWSHAVEDDEWEVDIWNGELGLSQSTAENGPPQWTPHIFQYQAFPATNWSEGDGRWQRFGLRIDKSASMGIWWRRFSIPLWMPACCFALVLLSSSLLRMRMRQQIGKCITCGYDLRATPRRCPECGTVQQAPKSNRS